MRYLKSENTLSLGARQTFVNIIDSLQNAEEMGGTEDLKDYINLMQLVSKEVNKRIKNAKSKKYSF